MATEKKLEVKNLVISFKTNNGKVQAVRNISFDLYKGETLAIVGESGSGKSVTSRAIMGILAGNAIPEGGKILYGDKDLMKISEEEFHRIRGDKIAMVFQDPLSSLNPIMRVGAQLTEAMLLKNKASRREAKKNMSRVFKALESNMEAAGVSNAKEDIAKFRKFSLKHCELESAYTSAVSSAQEAVAIGEHIVRRIDNKAFDAVSSDIHDFERAALGSVSYFVVREKADDLKARVGTIKSAHKGKDFATVAKEITACCEILKEALSYEVPNTFTLGYYLTFEKNEIPKVSVEELNAMTHKATEEDFMNEFLANAEKAVRYSAKTTDAHRAETSKLIREKLPLFKGNPDRSQCEAAIKTLKSKVNECLDPLEVIKDSLTHTFDTSIDYAASLYFDGNTRNEKEKKRFEKQTAKHDAIIAKGKTPEWEVIPASYVDLDAARADMESTLVEMADHFDAQIKDNQTADYSARALEVIDFLKELAQESVYKITRAMAREKAVKLMDSVGIDEPRRRFKQYPFEFSGGMRQRIVIAIALTANPDILICDEPTTALDVTIQAQILELINNLKRERDLSVIFITHDLGVVANMADRIAVMYAGKIVEYGTAADIFYSPAHPYTWALLSSVPDLDTKEKLESIPGTPPNMIYPPKGDAFADRNKYALEIDFEEQPPMFKVSDTHYAATWLLHPDAPKVDPPKIVTERIARMRGESK